jgi:esterase/lipase superfamily enzyme
MTPSLDLRRRWRAAGACLAGAWMALLGACAQTPLVPEGAWDAQAENVLPSRMRGGTVREPCPPEFSGTCYPVWYGTNRRPLDPQAPEGGFGNEADDDVHYGKRVVRIPREHRPGELGSPLWRRLYTGVDDRIALGPALGLSEDAFQREVRSVLSGLDPSDRQVLVYIHGFNTSFDDALLRAAQLGVDLQVPGVTAVFSWPSRASLTGYLSDLSAIEASEEQLAAFLVQVTRLAGPGKVHVIAHSMGNRGLLRAMHRATVQAALATGTRFGQIFLAAPDVDVKLFRQLASIYPQVAERTTLYVADQDKALAALEWFAEGLKAGGAPPVLVMPGIDSIHVRGTGLFRLGHSYVAEEPAVLRDIRAQLQWRASPQQRQSRYGWPVPHGHRDGAGAWRIGR